MVFHSVPRLIQRLFPQRTWEKGDRSRQVFLTFDDGPVSGVTDFVLNELAKHHMKATFFMVGANVEKNANLAREVLFAGNGVGNHTFHHLNGWKTKRQTYVEDFLACNQILEENLESKTTLFRPPYGTMTSQQAQIIQRSHELIMWSVLSGDYDKRLDPTQILTNTVRHLKPGAIVVLHDQEKTSQVIRRVLPDLLTIISDQGYQTAIL